MECESATPGNISGQQPRFKRFILTANTQINALNWDKLREMAAKLRARGIQVWQVQLTVPMGRAADHPEWIIEPWRVVDVIDTLAAIQREAAAEHVSGIPAPTRTGRAAARASTWWASSPTAP